MYNINCYYNKHSRHYESQWLGIQSGMRATLYETEL